MRIGVGRSIFLGGGCSL